jgi:hypothetical protein
MVESESPDGEGVPVTPEQIREAAALPAFNPTGLTIAGTRWSLSVGLTNTVIIGQVAADLPMARVHLSWPLAKALGQMIIDAVQQYEETEGEVPVPRTFTERQREGKRKSQP